MIRLAIAALPALLSMLFVAYRVLFVSVNHSGYTPHYLDIFSMASVLLALLLKLPRSHLWLVVTVAAMNMAVVVWAIDTHNLLEYEDWIRRGMPEKTIGAGAQSPKQWQ